VWFSAYLYMARVPDLRAWTCVAQSDGRVWLPPDGVSGAVRIRDEQRPMRSAIEIFARANTPELVAGAIESLITSEGEYAAFQKQRGTIDGCEVTRFVGAVFGDYAYTLVIASTSDHVAMVERAARACVTHCTLGLGHRRQRRYRHVGPIGWTEDACGLATRWSAPDGSELVVHASVPSTTPIDAILDAIRVRHRIEAMHEVAGPSSACHARAWQGAGLNVVILDDGRFRYPIELSGDEHRDVLARVVASVRLVPPAESTPITDALLHWTE
jgi:hypothetical protein